MRHREILVLGAGCVGLTIAACLAADGHRVTCVDVDADTVAELYAHADAPVLVTDNASNGLLSVKLSYANSLANLCGRVGADVNTVVRGMGHDNRIGEARLRPGPGWGGACLPKDARALLSLNRLHGLDFPLIQAALDTNIAQHERVVQEVRDALGGELAGARIGIMGMTFKAGTADLRDSPAMAIAELLRGHGADLTLHDPSLADLPSNILARWCTVDDPYLVAKGAEVVVVLTEWPQFRTIDWRRFAALMSGSTVVDTRNLLDVRALRKAGLLLRTMGLSC
ncbi:nucleotide sugar dehydrogenase [Kutzneria viridogrisea]|uniref:UDP-glucose 6-dehydrogenase n=1 Tax=Kutzneria viridogrisea TaxID=47990 RepID=A0ABR6B9T5_9PSEU|nr:nucleotide sugar dehydrogenase [Kutzneria viridogrisea]